MLKLTTDVEKHPLDACADKAGGSLHGSDYDYDPSAGRIGIAALETLGKEPRPVR